ncbi:MAG: PQ-loop repeat-containing protein [Alphaproteobacteria bacterium]|nr:PQ-loop repeat-containing protein [Alphaproteobacteria bacterium]
MIQIIGYIGSMAYALSGIPQAILSIKNGHSRGVSRGFAMLSVIGSSLSLIYALPRGDYVLLLNFGANIIVWGTVLKYSYFERR